MALFAGIICMMQGDDSEANRIAAVPAAAAAAVAGAIHTMSGFCKADDMQLSVRLFAAVFTADSVAFRILMLAAAAC